MESLLESHPAVSEADRAKLHFMLRANCSPTLPSNASAIKELSLATETMINNHEKEISRLTSLVVSLENQKRDWEEHKKSVDSLCAPIRRLSDDCLQRIFRLIDGRHEVYGRRIGIACPGLLMSQVCSQWRTVAFRHSGLWADIYVGLWRICHSEVTVAACAVQLQRILGLSSDRPLHIRYDSYHDDEWDGHVVPVVPMLIATSSRWRHLVLRSEQFLDTEFEGALSECDLSRLEYLEFIREDAEPNSLESMGTIGTVLNRAPRLTSLKLMHTIFEEPILTHHSLKSLTLVHFVPEELESIIKYFPGLTSVNLTVESCQIHVHPRPPFMLASLTSLQVTIDKGGYPFFDMLTLPCLSTLHVSNTDHDAPRRLHLGNFSRFLNRSRCTISSLSFNEMPFSSGELLQLLKLLPELESLELIQNFPYRQHPIKVNITSGVVDATLICALNKTNQPLLVPRLKTFSLSLPSVVEHDLVQMVQSRWRHPQPEDRGDGLRSLTLTVTKQQLDASKILPLRRLSAAGMQVRVMDETGFLIP